MSQPTPPALPPRLPLPVPPDRPLPIRLASNKPAKLSLIFGLLTILLFILASVPAIIFGIMGIIRAGKPGVGRGKGMAIAGIVLAAVLPPIQIAFVLVPAIDNARREEMQVASAANLKLLSIGLLKYANDHKACLPPDLQATYVYVNTPSAYRHPASKRPAPNAQNLNAESDYVYVYAGQKPPPSGQGYRINALHAQDIVLYEKLEFTHANSIVVAAMNGSVRRMKIVDFQMRLAMEEAGRDSRPPSRR